MSVVLFIVGLLLTGFPAQAAGQPGNSPYPNLTCSAPIRIMLAGDSITRGSSSGVSELDRQVGYRKDLWHGLNAAGYQVDFVGSLSHGQYYQTTEGFDPHHEGRSGWTDTQVANNIYNWLVANPAEIVLLHIGTNQVERSPTDVENILNEIDRYDQSVIVVLARIINQIAYSQVVRDFNNNVEAMALARIANGDKIIIVDMENGAGLNYSSYTTGGDMWDNLHPYGTGYAKMAQVWLDALRGILPVCAESSPIITSAPVTVATLGQAYSYDVEASGIPSPSFALTVAPEGMSINAATGLIAWTPNTAGAFDVTVEASNSMGATSQSFTMTVTDAGQPPVITSPPVTEGGVGLPYYYDVEASGTPAPSFALIASPAEMSIDAATGVIAWTPAAAGLFEVTVRAINSAGTQDQSFTISVQDGRQETMCPANLISYWPMNEAVGSTLFTDIQSGYNGSCSGAACPTAVNGKVAGALSFDGNDKVDIPHQADFNWNNTDSFSIELWVNTTQNCAGNKVFIGKYGGNTGSMAWWVGCSPTGNAYFSVRDSRKTSVGFGGTTQINNGNWHHLVAVYNGSSRQNLLYVNGQLEASRASNFAGDFVSNVGLTLGYYANSYFYRGILDEVAIYDRALDAGEIQQHYAHSAGGNSYCSVPETGQAPVIASAPVTTATVGQLYSYDVEASGNPPPSFALTAAPAGMSIDAASGLIAWTPNAAGAFNVTVEASNSAGTASQSFTVTVAEEVTETPTFFTFPVIAVVGQLYQYQAQASGTPPPHYTLTVAPQGMIIDPDTGLLQWTPEIPGLVSVTIVAENRGGAISQSFQILAVTSTSARILSLSNMILDALPTAGPQIMETLWIPVVTRSQ
ncbi:MAG: putative Ig domain-containing protein [Caldilineaceae bacterium]|nr:putative Ig domain-containing protein [Caldilineaceae bacterium]